MGLTGFFDFPKERIEPATVPPTPPIAEDVDYEPVVNPPAATPSANLDNDGDNDGDNDNIVIEDVEDGDEGELRNGRKYKRRRNNNKSNNKEGGSNNNIKRVASIHRYVKQFWANRATRIGEKTAQFLVLLLYSKYNFPFFFDHNKVN